LLLVFKKCILLELAYISMSYHCEHCVYFTYIKRSDVDRVRVGDVLSLIVHWADSTNIAWFWPVYTLLASL